MVIDIKETAKLIKEHNEFLVISHEHPDGDTLGCAFSLCEALRILGKKRKFLCCDEVTKDFAFLTDGFNNDQVSNPFIITVDVADLRLLGSLAEEFSGKVELCIDHHTSNTFFAKKTFLENRAAACELMYELILELGVEPNLYIRNAIYTGISTDTGCFRYNNVTPSTFKIVASLMEQGIDSKKINKLMFETKTKTALALDLLARETLEYHFDGRCAIITVTQDMYEKSGSNEHECFSITALPRQIEGVEVGVVIKEKKNGDFGVSVRTEGEPDASLICSRLGGGGHKGAAGCSFSCSLEEVKEKLLASIKEALGE
ncbi:MAG: bifunctional oligoribonuclease/PAP phosphatase NrnA [Acutalibacteraceae bacterium]